MQSGAISPVGDITSEYPQAVFDRFVADAGCGAEAAGNGDVIECLRGVDLSVFQDAVNKSPGTISYTVR